MMSGLLAGVVLLTPLLVLYFKQQWSSSSRLQRLVVPGHPNPAVALKLRALHAARSTKERARRDKLWHKAESNTRAAKELGRRIREDITSQRYLRPHLAALDDGGAALRALDAEQAAAEAELARLDALHHHHAPAFHPHAFRHSSKPVFLQWLGPRLAVVAGVVVYVVIFVTLAKALHFDPDTGFLIAAGGFLGVIGALGVSPILNDTWTANPLAVYVLAGGLLFLGMGGWREYSIVHGRAECNRMLASEPDVHRRLQLLNTHYVQGVPSLTSGQAETLSCRELLR